MVVDAHSLVQEVLQILKCRTEPNPIQQSYTNDNVISYKMMVKYVKSPKE